MKQKRKLYTHINNIMSFTMGWGTFFTAAGLWVLSWVNNEYSVLNPLIMVFKCFLVAETLMNSIISYAEIRPVLILKRANPGALRLSLTQQKEPLDSIISAVEDDKLRAFYGSDRWFWFAVLAVLVLTSVASWYHNALSEFITLLNVAIVFIQAKIHDYKIKRINEKQ